MSALLGSVAMTVGHSKVEGSVTYLKAFSNWKDERDPRKTILIHKFTPGSFEIFPGIIDEAPCWAEEGIVGCQGLIIARVWWGNQFDVREME